MRRFAPLLTLAAVVVLGGALFTLNVVGHPVNGTATAAATPPPVTPAPSQIVPSAAAEAPRPASPSASPAAVEQVAYTGRSAGNEVTVAIAVKDGRAVGYVCDGKKIEAWLAGSVTGADVALKSNDGGSTLVGTLDPAKSLGTVAVGGKQWPYAAQAATPPAGLYSGRAQVRGVLNKIGWIVLPDGTQTGVRSDGTATGPAPVLDPTHPDTVTLDGVPVVVQAVSGDAVIGS